MPDEDPQNFGAYRLLLLSDIHEMKEELKEMRECLQRVKAELLAMRIKSGMNTAVIAAIVGAVPGLVTALVMWWRGAGS